MCSNHAHMTYYLFICLRTDIGFLCKFGNGVAKNYIPLQMIYKLYLYKLYRKITITKNNEINRILLAVSS